MMKGKKMSIRIPILRKWDSSLKNLNTEPQNAEQVTSSKKNMENFKNFKFVTTLKEIETKKDYRDFYNLHQKLGEGAHSVVYRCTCRKTNRQMAIKLVKRRDEELIEQMKNCFYIMRELNHPSFPAAEVLFLDEEKISCQLVTELCLYPTLKEYMQKSRRRGEKISESRAAEIMGALFHCLIYLQKKGICHRDLKPENILYDPETGDIKIIDFEIARMQRYENEKLDMWTNTGTLCYRAPESFYRGYSSEIDMWSLGVIAYQLLLGQLPFQRQYEKDLIQAIKHQDLSYDHLDISNSAKYLLGKMLKKNPRERMTAEEGVSSPFILKNLPLQHLPCSLISFKSSYSNKEERETSDSDEKETVGNKFYDEESHFRFTKNFTKLTNTI